MCLAIPGKLIAVAQDSNGVRMGRANFGGIIKEVCLEYTLEAQSGDYVLVHVGFALGKVDEAEAKRTYEALESLNQLGDLGIAQPTPADSASVRLINQELENASSSSHVSESGSSP